MKVAKKAASFALALILAVSAATVNAAASESVTKKAIAKDSVKVSGWTYNGKSKAPSIKVTVDGKTLKAGTDYKITGTKKAKNAGTYKVTIKGIGKFSGTQTLTYKVKKAKVVIKANKKSSVSIKTRNKQNNLTLSTNKKFAKASKIKIVARKKLKNGKWSKVKQTNIFKVKNGKLICRKNIYGYKYKVTLKISTKNYSGKNTITIKAKK